MSDGNGNNQVSLEDIELPPHREAVVVQAARMQQLIQEDRDRLQRELIEARTKLVEANVQVQSLQNMMEMHQRQADSLQEQLSQLSSTFRSELESFHLKAKELNDKYRDERDDAVHELSRYKVMFSGMLAQMREFEVEHVPLVRPRAAAHQDEDRENQ